MHCMHAWFQEHGLGEVRRRLQRKCCYEEDLKGALLSAIALFEDDLGYVCMYVYVLTAMYCMYTYRAMQLLDIIGNQSVFSSLLSNFLSSFLACAF